MHARQVLALAAVVAANCAVTRAAAPEHESIASQANFGIGLMLFGCMTFGLASFYMVRSGDKDLELFSWKLFHSTISIFNAVAIFQVADEILTIFAASLPTWCQLLLDIAHMLAWYVAMQSLMGWVSGAVGFQQSGSDLEASSPAKARVERNMTCFAGLLGHVTGFAAINAWSTLQHCAYGSVKTWVRDTSFLPVSATVAIMLLAGLILHIMNKITKKVREHISRRDDGIVDWFEETWDDHVKETEDDVMALVMSFLAVQIIKKVITGVLPNTEGEDKEGASHSAMQILMLTSLALLFAGLLVSAFNASEFFRSRFNLKHRYRRVSSRVFNCFSMISAWCLLWSVDWMLPRSDDTIEKLILAITITVVAFLCVFGLDKLADKDWTSRRVDLALRNLIQALGVVLGFSWEQCFDYTWKSTVDLSPYNIMHNTLISKILLAGSMFAVIVPAWYWFIVPTVLRLEEERERARPTSIKEEPLLAGDSLSLLRQKELLEEELSRVRLSLQQSENRIRQLEESIKGQLQRDADGQQLCQPMRMGHRNKKVHSQSKGALLDQVSLARAARQQVGTMSSLPGRRLMTAS